MNRSGFVLLFLIALFVSRCTKQVAGPQGDSGTPGKPGNLKQSGINSLKVSSASWTLINNQWESLIFAEQITLDVIKKGEVRVYLQEDSQWWALPHGGKKYIFTQYSIEKGIVHLHCTHVHGGTPERPLDANYRIIVFSPAK